jgi:hypothetical protein
MDPQRDDYADGGPLWRAGVQRREEQFALAVVVLGPLVAMFTALLLTYLIGR